MRSFNLPLPSGDDADTAVSHRKLRNKIVFIVNSMMIATVVGTLILGDVNKVGFIYSCPVVKTISVIFTLKTLVHVVLFNELILFNGLSYSHIH